MSARVAFTHGSVASALPPDNADVGNTGWLHARFCMDCCPVEFASGGAS